ncbi:hypothetical protein L7F22_027711 [Adiantum nelumboides]|nr:hypothetical protein [Adiantum nelumboides]
MNIIERGKIQVKESSTVSEVDSDTTTSSDEDVDAAFLLKDKEFQPVGIVAFMKGVEEEFEGPYEDVAQNMLRSNAGRRYSKNTKAIFEVAKMWGDPRLHDFLSSNLNGPSLSSKKHGQREATQFIPGIHGSIFDAIAEIYQKEKEKHRITSKIPFILVEDETAIKKRIRWNAKDDTLVGFDGYKTDDHECMTTCMIKVGEGQEGYDKIVDAFQNCVVGGQWDAISSLWNEKLWPRIGMIIGHASDGDSRLRRLMLFDYMDTSGSRFGIPWKGWPLSAKMVDNGVIGLHDQDFIHNGKKLVNVLDKSKRQLAIGDVWITLNHVLIVYDAFSVDKHMLKEGDIRQDDRQNWARAQRICSKQVQWCLGENGKARKERSMLGTKAYLEVAGDYINIFLSQHLNLVERVHLAGKVSFFFQIWRDFYPGLKCPLHLTGSNAAEIFFSKIGSMVGQERSYDLMDMLHTAGILNRLAHFECKEDGPLFARAHKKQEHVWSELNHNESMPKAHLGDYDGVSTDEKIINALKKGLESAQAICERFHMKPKDKDKEKMRWWSKPWKNGFVDAFAKMDKLESDLVEEDLAPTAAEEVDSDNEASLSEIRHVVDSLLDEHVTVSPVVSIDSNKCMFKSTLVSQLNGNPTLSKDRLTRVCQGIYYSKKEKDQATSNDNLFGIGSDCAVFFVEEEKNTKSTRQGNPSSIQRKKKTKGTWYLGRVQKMRRKVGRGYVEYKRGFSLTKKPTRVQVQLGWYQKTKGSRCFTYDLIDLQMIDSESVIALANLTYDCKTNKYELEENDWKIFNDFVKDH